MYNLPQSMKLLLSSATVLYRSLANNTTLFTYVGNRNHKIFVYLGQRSREIKVKVQESESIPSQATAQVPLSTC